MYIKKSDILNEFKNLKDEFDSIDNFEVWIRSWIESCEYVTEQIVTYNPIDEVIKEIDEISKKLDDSIYYENFWLSILQELKDKLLTK